MDDTRELMETEEEAKAADSLLRQTEMNLFVPVYSFKHLHETSTRLNRTRVNQWRLRKIQPAEQESRGSGYAAKFSLWNLVHAELLAQFNDSNINLATAAGILKDIRKLIKPHCKTFREGDSMSVSVDLGTKSHPVWGLKINGEQVTETHGQFSNMLLDINLGQVISEKIRKVR